MDHLPRHPVELPLVRFHCGCVGLPVAGTERRDDKDGVDIVTALVFDTCDGTGPCLVIRRMITGILLPDGERRDRPATPLGADEATAVMASVNRNLVLAHEVRSFSGVLRNLLSVKE